MQIISSIIEAAGLFESISLAEMDHVKLMNRTDTKFPVPSSRLPMILERLNTHYKILSVNGKRLCTYKTLYYDTDGLNLYLAHHNERVNRYKIRHRSYVDSNLGFLEVKFKNNKNRTIKDRIKQNIAVDVLCDEAGELIRKKSGIDPAMLKPSVWVNYQRITLVSDTERVTIDVNLEFVQDGQTTSLPNMAIVEVKQSTLSASPVFNILKSEKLREISISKYCLGIISTHPEVKHNNFKQKIRGILKQCR